MSDEIKTRRDNALDFLDELDGRHDLLLAELEQLNQRIDSVLNEYTKSRQSVAMARGVSVEWVAAGNSPSNASNLRSEAANFD